MCEAAHQMNLPVIPGVSNICHYLKLNPQNLSQETRKGKKKPGLVRSLRYIYNLGYSATRPMA